jgi:hypothetical protein
MQLWKRSHFHTGTFRTIVSTKVSPMLDDTGKATETHTAHGELSITYHWLLVSMRLRDGGTRVGWPWSISDVFERPHCAALVR